MSYSDFISEKEFKNIDAGFEFNGRLPKDIKGFQSDIVKWALRRGRAAIFADTGLGKTLMQLSWAKAVSENHIARLIRLESRD